MFNFCRRNCGCNRCHNHHNDCRPQKPNCRPQKPDCKPHKPECHPVCFNVFFKNCNKCKEFDGCNAYPETYHDDCKHDFEMICCCK